MSEQPSTATEGSAKPNIKAIEGEYLQFGGLAVVEGVMMRSPNFYSVASRAPGGQIVVITEPLDKTLLGKLHFLKRPFLRGILGMLDTMLLGGRAMRWASNVQIEAESIMRQAEPSLVAPDSGTGPSAGYGPIIIAAIAFAFFAFGPLAKNAGSAIAWMPASLRGAVKESLLYRLEVLIPCLLLSVVLSLLWPKPGNKGASDTPQNPESMSAWAVGGALIVSLGIGAFVFKFLPEAAAQTTTRFTHDSNGTLTNYIAEFIKIGLFIGYLSLIRLYPPIKEVFKYHGAEHKSINVVEADMELTVENAVPTTRLHPRCGTNFAIIVLVIGLLFFPLIPRFGNSDANPFLVTLIRFGIDLCLIPVVAGIAYEIIRAAGRAKDQMWVNILLKPGLLTQLITTAEPEPAQIEVAIASLTAVMQAERDGELTNIELDKTHLAEFAKQAELSAVAHQA